MAATILQRFPSVAPQGLEWAWALLPADSTREALLLVRIDDRGPALPVLPFEERHVPDTVLAVISGRPPTRDRRLSLSRRALVALGTLTAAGRAWVAARRVQRRLDRAGFDVRRIPIGLDDGGYAIGLGPRRVFPAPTVALAGIRGFAAPSWLSSVVEAAQAAIGRPLLIRDARVLSGGLLMVRAQLENGTGYVLRAAHGDRCASLLEPLEVLRGLVDASPPPEVEDRLVTPEGTGELGELAWSIERHVPGRHPSGTSDRTWGDCLSFLNALATIPTGRGPGHLAHALAADADVIGAHIDADARRRLARVVETTAPAVEGLAPVWTHGDFHPGNLLAVHGSLTAVLDWDGGGPCGFPLADLLHLIATTDRRLRALPLGARWLEAGSPSLLSRDPRVVAYCESMGLRPGPSLLDALTTTYWLSRTARDLRTFPARASQSRWLELNVERPLERRGSAAERSFT